MNNQIKYFLLFLVLTYGQNILAQGTDCSSAESAVLGVNTAIGPSSGGGAENGCAFDASAENANWYSYTPTGNVSVSISSCLGGADTRLSVYSGTCAELLCVADNDDFCELAPGDNLWASSVTFSANANTTYFIQWDDRWDSIAFDWSLTEVGLGCTDLLLNIGDACDIVGTGDGIVSDECICVPIAAPDCATLVSPNDGAVEVPINPLNNGVELSWSFNGFQSHDNVNIYWGSALDELILLGATAEGSMVVNITNVQPGEYFWSAVPVSSEGEAVGCDVYSFSTEGIFFDVPNCPILNSPSDGATNVVPTLDAITISWTNSILEPSAATNSIYLGIDPTELVFLGDVDGDSESVEIISVEGGQTYYWSVVPSNNVGAAEGCTLFSFTVMGDLDCPELGLNFGSSCDDGNPNTLDDVVAEDECVCTGTPIPDNSNCGNATMICEGIYSANSIIGGSGAVNNCFPDGGTDALWYSFTAYGDGEATVDATIDLDQPDTRVSIYIGGCEALVCLESNDDQSADNFASIVTFPVVNGETYWIEWDDRWGTAEFDFEYSTITTSNETCPSDFTGNGTVNGEDLAILVGYFGVPCENTCNCSTDINGDGITDSDDFSIFLGNFGYDCVQTQ